ncbi:MAG: acetolactate decarboxylase [Flammeovirgaceae bacterium]
MKNLMLYLGLLGLISSCNQPQIEVKHIGELRQIMHKGKFEGRISLKDLPQENLYALGAVKALQGEILVLDGNPFVSRVVNGNVQIDQHLATEATLLVYAQVPAWDTIVIQQVGDISQVVEQQLVIRKQHKATPFMVLGKANSLHYHVINFDLEQGDIQQHREGAFQETLENEAVRILGFYATDAQGIYTHHDSHVHMHVINQNGDKLGHVEAVNFDHQSIQLLLPKL